MTMSKITINLLLLTLLVNQLTHTPGKLTTFRVPNKRNPAKVTCVSEDDGSALVWNAKPISKYYQNNNSTDKNAEQFSSTCDWSNKTVCETDSSVDCLNDWHGNFWKFTNSVVIPMGPVFDQRWEEFVEHKCVAGSTHILDNTSIVVLPFSVRAKRDMHILICREQQNNFCYWIIIGGWENTQSVIRKCPDGVPSIGKFPSEDSECKEPRASINHTAFAEYEWRTFVLTWNSQTRNISLYNPNQLIITYKDKENYKNSNFSYKLSIRCRDDMLIRYHHYNYLYTDKPNAILKSGNKFNLNTNAICIRMLIGLCAQCDADILLRNFITNEIVQNVTVTGSSVTAVHGLPMWQFVKIMINSTSNDGLKIEMHPKLNFEITHKPGNTENWVWALTHVRHCFQNGCFRKGTVNIYKDWANSNKSFWFNVNCQKLFYEEQFAVRPFDYYNENVKLDDKSCIFEHIETPCRFDCKSTLKDETHCENIVICYDNGCTCPAGSQGYECFASCDSNVYGHACKESCGKCQGYHLNSCNEANEKCRFGYKNTPGYIYKLLFCKIGIGKPNETEIISKNQTTIMTMVPFKWEKKYEELELSYSFEIEGDKHKERKKWKRISQNTSELLGTFTNLQPDTTYVVIPIFSLTGTEISGSSKMIRTDCDPIPSFHITPNERSLIIEAGKSENQSHPCPTDSYEVQFINKDNENEQPKMEKIHSFPYTIPSLTPYTSYDVTIWHRNKNLFWKKVRTLEDVPSAVIIRHAMLLSNSQVNILWRSPERPQGVIKDYIIFLRVVEYFGCQGYNISTSSNSTIVKRTNKTETIFSGLHAYVKYNVEVRANNSRYLSEPARIEFNMEASVIPTVTFSQLKISNWELSWNRPEDCTAISGPLNNAKIKIQGISEAVKNFNVIKNTAYSHLNLKNYLYGTEQYVAKIFAQRGPDLATNESVYQEILFETPPKAPPTIINLEVVEIEEREINKSKIHLRWQSPHPPLNGILHGYNVVLCFYDKSRCTIISVQLDEFCDLWDNYICKNLPFINDNIQVVVYNKNVSEASSPVFVTPKMLLNTTPDAPRNCTFSVGNNSVVDLEWLHPWRTSRRLDYFNVTISEILSELRSRTRRSIESRSSKLFVTNYMRNYSMQLYLLPSTQYKISINSVTIENKGSNTITLNVRTPSTIDFIGKVTSDVHESDSTIAVNVPHIVNDTRFSTLYIIVKGLYPCDNYLEPSKNLWKQADIKKQDIAWQAVAVPTNLASDKIFTLGSSETYGKATNCPLKTGESYDIVVIISEPNFSYKPIMVTRRISMRIGTELYHLEPWITFILIIILVAAIIASYFYERKRKKSSRRLRLRDDSMALSQVIENYEPDARCSYVSIRSVISDSVQVTLTTSDRPFISQISIPEVPARPFSSDNNDEQQMTSLVKVKDFEGYVKRAIESGLLNKQYETFPRGQTQPWNYGKLPQNKSKNRYEDLIAYDETRVVLEKLPNDAYSDYINANYITGYKKKKSYIATQGPKPNTVVDFWRMIWQEEVRIICMLVNVVENGKTKCEQYWPAIGKKKKYGEIIVENSTHNVFADYCFRTFHITHKKETRKVEHLHYTTWPHCCVPLYIHSVVTYLKKLLAISPGDGPVVVHSSAGVGSTGTIILCDICLRRAAAEGVVDVFAETASMRRERANMVENKQQYLLAHLALVECLLTTPTTLPCNKTLPTRIKELKKQLLAQQQRLQNSAWQDEALRPDTATSVLSKRNRAKNRFPELISDKMKRIYLEDYPTSYEDSDYLSGVYVDGVRVQNQYLATQLPMPSTINDFWRMIAEFKVQLIVMLQPPDPHDPTCCSIAPENGEFKPTPYINVTAEDIVESEIYTKQKLLLVDNSETPSREQSVTILCCTEWKSGRNQSPPSVITMVKFWQATEKIGRDDGPIVTLCHDGVTGCGLYLAMSFMLERMTVEKECDVCLAVRAVRRSRPDFVQSLEHLGYLYNAAIAYLQCFETYANFS